MSKFVIVSRQAVDEMLMLYRMKQDNVYSIIEENNGFSTIAQYSGKFDSVKIVTVKSENLDTTKRLTGGLQ